MSRLSKLYFFRLGFFLGNLPAVCSLSIKIKQKHRIRIKNVNLEFWLLLVNYVTNTNIHFIDIGSHEYPRGNFFAKLIRNFEKLRMYQLYIRSTSDAQIDVWCFSQWVSVQSFSQINQHIASSRMTFFSEL